MARKRLSDEEVYPYFWNPEIGWQILRRSKLYQTQADSFFAFAEESGDSEILDFYEHLLERDNTDEDIRRWIMQDPIKPPFPEYGPHYYAGVAMNPNKLLIESWLRLYSDIIIFPIPWRNPSPLPVYLSALWTLRPCTMSEWSYLDKCAKPLLIDRIDSNHSFNRIVHFTVEINPRFSDARILEAGREALETAIGRMRRDTSKSAIMNHKIHWENLLEGFKIWDLKHPIDRGVRPLGFEKISNIVYKDRALADKKRTAIDRYNYLLSLIQEIEYSIVPDNIQFFSRTRPSKVVNRRRGARSPKQ